MARTKECGNRVELILCAAQELFGRYGFERTTIDDIARQAGIGKGSIYLEFSNKDEIFMAVVKQFLDRKQAMMETHLQQATAPYLESMKQMLLDSIMSSYDVCTAHVHTAEIRVHTSFKVRAHFKDAFVNAQAVIEKFLEKAISNGEVESSSSVQRLADLLMLSCSGLKPPYLQYRIPGEAELPSRQNLEDDAEELLNVLINGLKTRRS